MSAASPARCPTAEYATGLAAAGLSDVSLTATHAVADGMDSVIIKATKALGAGAAVSAPVIDQSRRELPVAASGCGCGSGCCA